MGALYLPLLGGTDREIAVDGTVAWRAGGPVGDAAAQRVGDTVGVGGVRGRHTVAWAAGPVDHTGAASTRT